MNYLRMFSNVFMQQQQQQQRVNIKSVTRSNWKPKANGANQTKDMINAIKIATAINDQKIL